MSSANAAAIKRRAQPKPTTPAPTPTPQYGSSPQITSTPNNVNSPGLTLQQVISIIDKRLVKVESFVQESRNVVLPSQPATGNAIPSSTANVVSEQVFSTMVEEFNHRFELLATEIDTLKDIVLKLQSFTMEINKTLVDERIHILSDLGNVEPTTENDKEIVAETYDHNADSAMPEVVELETRIVEN